MKMFKKKKSEVRNEKKVLFKIEWVKNRNETSRSNKLLQIIK